MSELIVAIDPGNTRSALVAFDADRWRVVEKVMADNETVLAALGQFAPSDACVIEMVACYGMAVGKSVFDTCRWIGRFEARWKARSGHYPSLMFRRTVKLHLCNSVRAKDGNVRQSLLDQFPPLGGGKTPQVGTKGQPGPLFGISKDLWAALGVAVTAATDASAAEIQEREADPAKYF